MEGETLFISLPLSRIFSTGELGAVIGHELGHFRGDDTYFSLKFAPVYAGLSHAVESLGGDGSENSGVHITTYPAYALLSYMIEVFHTNVSVISREPEFEADKAAVEVASPIELTTALLKVSLYANAWAELEQRIVERMQRGCSTINMAHLFGDTVKYDVNKQSLPVVIKQLAEQTIPHPTDSHPPTGLRIQQVGCDLAALDYDTLLAPDSSASHLVDGHLDMECELTHLQQQYYVAMSVQVPEEQNIDWGARVLAAFGAHMVIADGVVDAEEIDVAEEIGRNLSENFDYIDFREYCNYPDTLPEVEKLIEASREVPIDGRKAIIDFLTRISTADGDLSSPEAALLSRLGAAFFPENKS